MFDDNKISKNTETRVCKVCGEELPLDRFELIKPKNKNPYHIYTCKKCRYDIRAERRDRLRENVEILIERKYKKINPERILDLSQADVQPIESDEIFVKLMDYRDTWLSNYGRVIRFFNEKYNLLKGSYNKDGVLIYSLRKNVLIDGEWIYKRVTLYAAQEVIKEFVVNPDTVNNVFVWHKGHDKMDNYYKNLYPLNNDQYQALKRYFKITGDDSEKVILNVMNDIQYMPDTWSVQCLKPVMCGKGYHGRSDVDCKSKAYLRWHDMMNRCYNEKFHERNPQYRECTVCEEWWNFSNFEKWYNDNWYIIDAETMDLDKDILIKGNNEYSPATCCIVPHGINTLFLTCKKNRGNLPMGIYYDKDKKKYRAGMSYCGVQMKIGRFDTIEDAFNKYKEYKEDFIKDIAEQYRGKLPDKVYYAMINWKIEITD